MASIPRVDSKDPSEVLDYEIDMSRELAGRGAGGLSDELTAVSWRFPADLTLVLEQSSTTKATVFLRGGVVGKEYLVTAHMTTSSGRTYERSFRFKVEER
jgi:hypothetical protein